MVSRVTGLLREACLSRVFGAGALMDAFFLAFLIPNLFRRLFGEGALAAAFLPVYVDLEKRDPAAARRLASMIVALLVVVLSSIVLLGDIALYLLVRMGDMNSLAIWLTMIMLPYIPLVCLVALLGAMLQVHGRFGPTAAAPILLNLCVIGAALGFSFVLDPNVEQERVLHIGFVAGSVIIAGILQLAWTLWALRSQQWWTPEGSADRNAVRRVLRQALPMILGLGVLQVNVFLDGLIASYPTTFGPTIFGVDYPLQQGAMASVTFAQRLYQFPLGVFGIAVATAIFPTLARLSSDQDAFTDTVRRGLRLVVFIGLPASIGLLLVREPIAQVVLQGGEFTEQDTRRVAFVLAGYAPAIWAYSMIQVLTRAFYARGDSIRPVKVAIWFVGLNLVLNCTLIWTPLREAGLAVSTAVCACLQSIVLTRMLRAHTGALVDRSVRRSWIATCIATVIMATVVGYVAWQLTSTETWLQALGVLAILVSLGAATVACTAAVLRMPELHWAVGKSTG